MNNHVADDFNKYGGSYLLSSNNYEDYVQGHNFIGRPDGQFITPSNQIDDMLNKYPDNPREWERQLGLNEGSLGDEKIRRVDVYNPQDYEPRLPTSDLSGANDKFLEGQGKVPGGQDECVINQFPNPDNNPRVGKISEVSCEQYKTNTFSSEQTQNALHSSKVAKGGCARAPNEIPSNYDSNRDIDLQADLWLQGITSTDNSSVIVTSNYNGMV